MLLRLCSALLALLALGACGGETSGALQRELEAEMADDTTELGDYARLQVRLRQLEDEGLEPPYEAVPTFEEDLAELQAMVRAAGGVDGPDGHRAAFGPQGGFLGDRMRYALHVDVVNLNIDQVWREHDERASRKLVERIAGGVTLALILIAVGIGELRKRRRRT